MVLTFSYIKEESDLFGLIYRPVALVKFLSKTNSWVQVEMVVDSGADYSLLPKYLSEDLHVNLKTDCKLIETNGVGGSSRVYFLPKIKIKLGKWERNIPIGFVDSDDVPPLLGRHLFMETFETNLSRNHKVSFSV